MWALGVILYILYFKKFPYDGKNSTEIKNKILFEPVSYPKNVKVRKTLMNLINKLLDKNSDDRISTADESFSNYFNDNDTKSSAFIFSRQISKSLKENYKAEKLNDIMQLIEKLKTNNDK